MHLGLIFNLPKFLSDEVALQKSVSAIGRLSLSSVIFGWNLTLLDPLREKETSIEKGGVVCLLSLLVLQSINFYHFYDPQTHQGMAII